MEALHTTICLRINYVNWCWIFSILPRRIVWKTWPTWSEWHPTANMHWASEPQRSEISHATQTKKLCFPSLTCECLQKHIRTSTAVHFTLTTRSTDEYQLVVNRFIEFIWCKRNLQVKVHIKYIPLSLKLKKKVSRNFSFENIWIL